MTSTRRAPRPGQTASLLIALLLTPAVIALFTGEMTVRTRTGPLRHEGLAAYAAAFGTSCLAATLPVRLRERPGWRWRCAALVPAGLALLIGPALL